MRRYQQVEVAESSRAVASKSKTLALLNGSPWSTSDTSCESIPHSMTCASPFAIFRSSRLLFRPWNPITLKSNPLSNANETGFTFLEHRLQCYAYDVKASSTVTSSAIRLHQGLCLTCTMSIYSANDSAKSPPSSPSPSSRYVTTLVTASVPFPKAACEQNTVQKGASYSSQADNQRLGPDTVISGVSKCRCQLQ